MIKFLSELFINIPLLVTTITIVVGGLVAIYGLFDKKLKKKQMEEKDLDERIRSLYKEENAAQEEKIDELLNTVEKLQKQVDQLSKENKVMRDIFQGRDAQTIEFQKQGFEAIATARDMKNMIAEQKEISISNKNGIEQINKNIERLAKAIEKHLDNTQKGGETK